MMDFTGDKNSIFTCLGASNHTDKQREDNDYYATDPIAIDKLAEALKLPHDIWECACGEGHLSRRLEELGFRVYSSDKVNRGYGRMGDFFGYKDLPIRDICIVTNPPYRYALEFIEHALSLLPANGICCMFLKTTFLEGQKRYDRLFSSEPPKYVLQFSRRVLCAKNGEFQRMRDGGGSAVSYAWFVWEKGFKGDTVVKWI